MIVAEFMRERARALLASVGLDAPPVDVEKVAESLGFLVTRFPFPEGTSGATVIDGTARTIGVNERHYPTRQRFTIAHELGHYVGGHEDYHVYDSKTHMEQGLPRWAHPGFQQEREADEFAAELLMPQPFLERDLKQRRYTLTDLAQRYEVSPQAMVIQITDLGLHDALALP